MTFLTLAAFHTRQLLRTSFFVQEALFAPLSFVLLKLFGSWGSHSALTGQLWFDAALAGMWATTTTAVGIIGFQRFQGTLEHLALSVLRPGTVFGSLCAAASFLGLIGLPIAVGCQLLLTHSFDGSAQLFAGFLLGVVACVSSAFALASLFVLSRSATVYEPLILTPIWLLSGIVVPLVKLPAWLTPIAAIHPLTGAVRAGQASTWSQALPWLAESLAASTVWTALAVVLLTAALRRARVSGTLALA